MSTVADMIDAVRSAGSVGVRGHSSRKVPLGERRPDVWVGAPSGVLEFQADEMTVRCGAGTPVVELQGLLAERRQFVNLPDSTNGTIGGALATGVSGLHTLGCGSIRDTLLEMKFVDHEGRLVKAGGPTVKNVSGFDLCRLFVGSYGVLGFAHEFVLRTRPLPSSRFWFSAGVANVDELREVQVAFFRPWSLLWNGERAWLCLAGDPRDIDEQIAADWRSWEVVGGPPDLGSMTRRRVTPNALPDVVAAGVGRVVGEVGVGIVHQPDPFLEPSVDRARQAVVERVLHAFDPLGRLNPQIDRAYL